MKRLNTFQRYFAEEFYDDYREGLLSRRTLIRRLAFITGSMTATVSTMSLLGCTVAELPAPTEPMPTPEPTAAAPPTPAPAGQLTPVPGAQSPLSVPEGDPAVSAAAVTFASADADITAYLARPVAEGVYPGVLVCHENRGLTPHIRDVARRFAKAGYVALAVDLLAREGGTDALDFDQIPGLLSGAPAARHVGDFAAGLAYLQAQPHVDGERIAMTGYCFGGGITWRCATALPALKAAAPYYGPAPDLADVPNIQAAVLGVYAENDSRINAGIPALEQALQDAGITHRITIYPGVNHAFHNDTGTRYDEAQATQAWRDTLDWFAQYV